MKKKQVCSLLVSLVLLQTACSTTRPVSRSTTETHNEARLVQPGYETVTKSKKLPFVLGCSLVGAGFGYAAIGRQKDSKGVPYTASQIQNNRYQGAGIMAGLTFIGVGFGYVFNRNAASSTRWLAKKTTFEAVTSRNFKQWLEAYNQRNGTNFVPVGRPNNYASVYLVPPRNVDSFITRQQKIDEEKAKIAELRRQKNQETLEAIFVVGALVILSSWSDSHSTAEPAKRSSRLNCSEVYRYIEEAYAYSSQAYSSSSLSYVQSNASRARNAFDDAKRAARNCGCDNAYRLADDGYTYANKACNSTRLNDAQSYARQARSVADNTKSATKGCENE